MSTVLSPQQKQPKEIKRLGEEAIQVTWKDGHVSQYPYTYLRQLCPCAECATIRYSGYNVHSLFSPSADANPERIPVPEDIRPVNMELVGRYAIQITWSDGHASGIYSFETLREICPSRRPNR